MAFACLLALAFSVVKGELISDFKNSIKNRPQLKENMLNMCFGAFWNYVAAIWVWSNNNILLWSGLEVW